MGSRHLEVHARLEAGPAGVLDRALATLPLSARGFDRIRRVAVTLADLEGAGRIEERHVAEAIQYRRWAAIVGDGAWG